MRLRKSPRTTTVFRHGPGKKDSQIGEAARTGHYDDETWTFISAVDSARRQKGHSLLTSEIFQVVLNLGYRRTEAALCAGCKFPLAAAAQVVENNGKVYCLKCGER